MIFRQWQQVLDESKTETRRVMKVGEYGWIGGHRIVDGIPVSRHTEVCTPLNHRKWAVGSTYAVQAGRGKPAIWILPEGAPIDDPLAEYVRKAESTRATWGPKVKKWLRLKGYREARIRITEIRREKLWEISLADIKAEGIRSWSPDGMLQRLEWRALWDSINAKKGDQWSENPLTWVLTFELVSEGES